MKILYYDCFAGISGDMNLGAMIDLGVDKDFLISELSKVKLSGYTIEVSRDKRHHIEGTRVNVILIDKHEKHPRRNLKDIEQIIDSSSLNDSVKTISKTMFQKLAEAESKIHGMPIERIHFHEVGAVDSIVDIVGAAICFDHLKIDKTLCSPVELGGGFEECQHGMLPIPAPATVEILKEVPVKTGAVQTETTTPTGAAILATLVNKFTDKTNFTINKTGYGIGSKEMDIPNILRVCLGESTGASFYGTGVEREAAIIIECNIDDMNPELYEHVMEKLFTRGALDTYLTPIHMKKSRPGNILSVLCTTDKEKEIVEIIFKETTTLGVRKYTVDKFNLKREFKKVKTRFGIITVKIAYYNDKIIRVKPEYEECKRIAGEKKVSIQDIYSEVSNLIKTDDT